MSELYIPTMGLPFLLEEICGPILEYINRSQTHECGNWGWGRAIPRKGIYKRNCRCSAPIGYISSSLNLCPLSYIYPTLHLYPLLNSYKSQSLHLYPLFIAAGLQHCICIIFFVATDFQHYICIFFFSAADLKHYTCMYSLLYSCRSLTLHLCRACLHSFFIDRQSTRELRITRILRDG